MKPTLDSRRHALRVLATTAVIPLVACTNQAGAEPEPFGDVTAGNLADLPVGALRPVHGAPAIIGRDSRGLYAMTSTCTHEGCDMIDDGRIDENGLSCGCHGARFDRNGGVKSGPAENPLTHFDVSVDASGQVTVHGGTEVSASKRKAVA